MSTAKLRSRLRPLLDRARKAVGISVIYCLGDSHTDMFVRLDNAEAMKKTRFRCCAVAGATAMGVRNPNSKSNAKARFDGFLDRTPAGGTVLVCLGEVDCGFVIWHRALRHGTPVEAQLEQALSNYRMLVEQIESRGRDVILCSAPLPTIRDGQDWGEVANLRREVTATLRERTDLTLRFNGALREMAAGGRRRYLDLQTPTLDPATGLVRADLINPDKLDHHLSPQAVTPVLVRALGELGYT